MKNKYRATAKNCSICGHTYTGWGHNAQPINNGRCCDDCNTVSVIPRRMRDMFGKSEAAEEQDS